MKIIESQSSLHARFINTTDSSIHYHQCLCFNGCFEFELRRNVHRIVFPQVVVIRMVYHHERKLKHTIFSVGKIRLI